MSTDKAEIASECKIEDKKPIEESTADAKKEEKTEVIAKPVDAKKKASPFLSTEVKEEKNAEDENTSTKRQHEQIDKMSKDRSIFNATGKLYFKSSKTGKMETRGEGKFLILKDDAGMYKLMMIRDLVMLKGCNHYISPTCNLVKATQAKNSWIWTALHDQSDAEKKEDETVYFAMFKTEETSKLFEEKYKEAQAENLKTLESKKSTEVENK